MADNEPKGYGAKFKDMVIAAMDYAKAHPARVAIAAVVAVVVIIVLL